MGVVYTDGLWGRRRGPQRLPSTRRLSWGPTLPPAGPMRSPAQGVAHAGTCALRGKTVHLDWCRWFGSGAEMRNRRG